MFELPVKWCKTCLKVCILSFPLAQKGHEQGIPRTGRPTLAARARVRQKVSQLTSFVEYFIV